MFEIGNSLREARLRRQINLVEAEQDTKIRSKYLAALEKEEFDVLPGVVYTRGFLRSYANYLGLDSRLYIDEYNARFGQFEDAEDAVASHTTTRAFGQPRRGLLNLRSVAIASLLVLALLMYLGLRAGAPTVASGDGALGQSATQQLSSGAREYERYATQPAEPTPVTPTVANLVVTARAGSTWLQVRRGSRQGKVIFTGTISDGSRKVFTGGRLHVSLGYPSAASLQLRGIKGSLLRPTAASTQSFIATPEGITRVDG